MEAENRLKESESRGWEMAQGMESLLCEPEGLPGLGTLASCSRAPPHPETLWWHGLARYVQA